MSKRPPNELESKLHQAALSAPKQELTNKQAEAVVPDANARQNALNFLLGVGLFKSLTDVKGRLTFRAVTKVELVATKDLSGEESLVLSHIKASRNEGIWTKHLKAKTNLHQTIIDRCLKTLIQKKLIKRVQSVQHQTRKIYMLENLEPSIALTGGPWYTDNELDTQFIELLSRACLKFIQDRCFPQRSSQETQLTLFPISNSPQYPTAQQIRNFLKQRRITETDLTVEHVEMLLNVLVLDGEIEKIPAFGASLWDSNAIDNGADSTDEREPLSIKKRKRQEDEQPDIPSNRKRKKKATEGANDASASEDNSLQKKSKTKRTRGLADSDSDMDTESPKRKKLKKGETDGESPSADEEGTSVRKRTLKKRSKRLQNSSEIEHSSSESEFDHLRSRRNRKSSKSTIRSPSPFQSLTFDEFSEGVGAHVYRAVRQERLSLGWSQSPCSTCPSFDFCKDGGPVNPRECVYYGEWLVGGISVAVSDES